MTPSPFPKYPGVRGSAPPEPQRASAEARQGECAGLPARRRIGALRVTDVSVMPRLNGGNSKAPTIMVAQRAAAFLTGQRERLSVHP